MQKIIAWIFNHPETVASILCAILTLIIWFIKKKPIKVVDTLKEKILAQLPYVILKAEQEFGPGNGEKKLQFVIDFFTWSFDEDGLKLGDSYIKFIKDSVEQILSTPQKK